MLSSLSSNSLKTLRNSYLRQGNFALASICREAQACYKDAKSGASLFTAKAKAERLLALAGIPLDSRGSKSRLSAQGWVHGRKGAASLGVPIRKARTAEQRRFLLETGLRPTSHRELRNLKGESRKLPAAPAHGAKDAKVSFVSGLERGEHVRKVLDVVPVQDEPADLVIPATEPVTCAQERIMQTTQAAADRKHGFSLLGAIQSHNPHVAKIPRILAGTESL